MNRDGAAARLMIIVATASERQCSDLIRTSSGGPKSLADYVPLADPAATRTMIGNVKSSRPRALIT